MATSTGTQPSRSERARPTAETTTEPTSAALTGEPSVGPKGEAAKKVEPPKEESAKGERTVADASSAPAKQRQRDPLLAAICHDLRAPLAAVTMGANFVLQTTPEDEASGRSRRVLQAILRSCKQMERLVRDFGDLSEIEADAVQLRMGIHDAGEMLEMIAEAARPNGLARNIVLNVTRPSDPVLLRCDRDRVLRALGHVVDNAVRFTPDSSTVALAVDEVDGKVRFSVSDQGPGLSEETLANLYDRTWHAKRAERVGAGLGLAIVRGVLQAHGGSVEVDTKPGSPTTFRLVLPKDTVSSPKIEVATPAR